MYEIPVICVRSMVPCYLCLVTFVVKTEVQTLSFDLLTLEHHVKLSYCRFLYFLSKIILIVLFVFQMVKEDLSLERLLPVLTPQASELISNYDEHALVNSFKFGVIYQGNYRTEKFEIPLFFKVTNRKI